MTGNRNLSEASYQELALEVHCMPGLAEESWSLLAYLLDAEESFMENRLVLRAKT